MARRVAIRCRVVLKPRAHGGMRGGMACAWRRPWATFGSQCDAQCNPRKWPTVGAGSSRFSRRFPRPSRPPPRILSRPPFPVVMARMVMSAQMLFVVTWRAASQLKNTASRLKNAASRFRHRVALPTPALRLKLLPRSQIGFFCRQVCPDFQSFRGKAVTLR